MKLSPLLLAVRAVSAEFAERLFIPVLLIVGGALFALLIVVVWLVTLSGWWWFLLAPLIIVSVVFIFVVALTRVALIFLKPPQTKAQRQSVRTFVDALQESSETITTPKFVLFFYVVRDVLFPTKEGFVRKVAANASTLQREFTNIIKSF